MNHPQVRQFQLVQQSSGAITIRYVPDKTADIEALQRLLLGRYSRLFGNQAVIAIERVDSIAPGPGGKSRLVVSHYKPAGSPP